MLKLSDAIIDPRTIGRRFLLSSVSPIKEYVNGHPTDRITGYRYTVILVDKKYSEFTVKIEGPKQLDVNDENCIPIEFEGLELHVGWSNPCFEIWLYAYFGEMPNIQDSVSCCSRFFGRFEKETGHPYGKNDTEVYRRITKAGDFELAYQIAERKCSQAEKEGKKPSQACPACTVHRLVKEIKDKTGI